MKFSLIQWTVFSTACFAALSAQAQVVTDGQWRATGGASLALSSGNSSTTAFLLTLDGYRATTADKITFGAMANYARSRSSGVTNQSSEKWYGFGQYDWNLNPKLFAFGRGSLEGDGLIDLTSRATLAGGMGYRVIVTPVADFTVYGGLAYSADKYDTLQFIDNKIDSRFDRLSLYMAEESSHKLNNAVSFKQRLDLYPGLTGDKAFVAKFTAGLTVSMSNHLGLNVGLINTYNSKAPLGSKKNDLALFTGLNVKFGAN